MAITSRELEEIYGGSILRNFEERCVAEVQQNSPWTEYLYKDSYVENLIRFMGSERVSMAINDVIGGQRFIWKDFVNIPLIAVFVIGILFAVVFVFHCCCCSQGYRRLCCPYYQERKDKSELKEKSTFLKFFCFLAWISTLLVALTFAIISQVYIPTVHNGLQTSECALKRAVLELLTYDKYTSDNKDVDFAQVLDFAVLRKPPGGQLWALLPALFEGKRHLEDYTDAVNGVLASDVSTFKANFEHNLRTLSKELEVNTTKIDNWKNSLNSIPTHLWQLRPPPDFSLIVDIVNQSVDQTIDLGDGISDTLEDINKSVEEFDFGGRPSITGNYDDPETTFSHVDDIVDKILSYTNIFTIGGSTLCGFLFLSILIGFVLTYGVGLLLVQSESYQVNPPPRYLSKCACGSWCLFGFVASFALIFGGISLYTGWLGSSLCLSMKDIVKTGLERTNFDPVIMDMINVCIVADDSNVLLMKSETFDSFMSELHAFDDITAPFEQNPPDAISNNDLDRTVLEYSVVQFRKTNPPLDPGLDTLINSCSFQRKDIIFPTSTLSSILPDRIPGSQTLEERLALLISETASMLLSPLPERSITTFCLPDTPSCTGIVLRDGTSNFAVQNFITLLENNGPTNDPQFDLKVLSTRTLLEFLIEREISRNTKIFPAQTSSNPSNWTEAMFTLDGHPNIQSEVGTWMLSIANIDKNFTDVYNKGAADAKTMLDSWKTHIDDVLESITYLSDCQLVNRHLAIIEGHLCTKTIGALAGIGVSWLISGVASIILFGMSLWLYVYFLSKELDTNTEDGETGNDDMTAEGHDYYES